MSSPGATRTNKHQDREKHSRKSTRGCSGSESLQAQEVMLSATQDRRKLFCSVSSKGKILTEYQIHSGVPDVKKDVRELQEIQKEGTIRAGLGNKL